MFKRIVWGIGFFIVFGFSSVHADNQSQSSGETVQHREIDLWSGSRTTVRRDHEREVLEAALRITKEEYGGWELVEYTEDYHGDRESLIFKEYDHDLFVTTAGNRKLEDERKIVNHKAVMKGILGYRVLIIREEDKEKFSNIESEDELKELQVGIPDTWSDAMFFRLNGYNVVERGTYDDMFERLHNHEFDFTALGANEIENAFEERAEEVGGLIMVDHLLVYYPFPLLFYVNPDEPELAERIEKGMKKISENSTLNEIFFKYNRELIERLNLSERTVFRLENPLLPEEMADFESGLLN